MFGFVKKIFSPFSKMGSGLGKKIRDIFSKPIDEETYIHLEKLLYEADIGPAISGELVEKLKSHIRKNSDPESILPFLKQELLSFFHPTSPIKTHSPHLILMVGVNGSGKTTTLAKLASLAQKEGKKVLIAAGDTFRAAASEQLELWAKKIGVDLIRSQTHSDPSAVVFDALDAAKARNSELILIDTAGRLQNKQDLMQELSKIKRTCAKQIEGSPHETLLVIDATVGQNALDQVRAFHQITPITGIVLTKLDGSTKGGIAIPIQKEFNIPILWVGLGEKEEDLVPFDVESYLNGLLANG